MSASQNIIHSSAINLAYANKASAKRCSILIESIFESKILPELEKAISNKLPDGFLVELSKLEINIGKIEEKDLPEKLAGRIRKSLEDALYNRFDLKNRFEPNYKRTEIQNRDKYLLESLGLFMAKGYFPFDTDRFFDIDELVLTALSENRKGLLELIRKSGRHESATKRITYTLKEKTVDKLLAAIDPVNSKWITDFRKILIYHKKVHNFSRLSDAEFLRTINQLILNFLLNETSLIFNREKFSTYILNEINDRFNPDLSALIHSVKKQPGNEEMSALISASLSGLQKSRTQPLPENRGAWESENEWQGQMAETTEIRTDASAAELPVDELFDAIEEFLLSGEFQRAAENRATIDDLISSALNQNPARLLELVQKYSSYDAVLRRFVFSTQTAWPDRLLKTIIPAKAEWISEFKKALIFAQKESGIKSFRAHEFSKNIDFSIFKYLLTTTRQTLDEQSFSASVLKQFLNRPAPETKLFVVALKNYPGNRQISEFIGKSLEHIRNSGEATFAGEPVGEPDIDQLTKALNSGQMLFENASRRRLRHEIIRAISDSAGKERFINRLNETGAKFILDLFFPDQAAGLFKFVSSFVEDVVEADRRVSPGNRAARKINSVLETVWYLVVRQNEQPGTEELMLFLMHSSGLDESETIKSEPFVRFAQAQKNFSIRKLHALIAREKQFPEITATSNLFIREPHTEKVRKEGDDEQTSPAEAYNTVIRRKIMETYLVTGQLPLSYPDLTKTDLRIIFHELIRQKDDFLIMQLRKSDVSGELATHLKNLVTNRAADDLEEYLAHFFPGEFSDFMKLLADLKQKLSADEPNQLSDKKLTGMIFLTALSESNGPVSPDSFRATTFKILSQSHGTNWLDLELLVHFLPEATSSRDYLKNMPQPGIVGLFEFISQSQPKVLKTFFTLLASNEELFRRFISESAEAEKLSERGFFRTFLNRLQQTLNAVSEEDSFQALVENMSLSGQKVFREFAEPRRENISSGESQWLDDQRQEDVGTQQLRQRMARLFAVLKFYSNNGFLPWWAGQGSIGEMLEELRFLSRTQPVYFGEAFAGAEEEDPVFENLLPKLPQRVLNELEQIFNQHKQLRSVWNEIKRKSRENSAEKPDIYSIEAADFQHLTRKDATDSRLLYQAIYFRKDKALLKQLFGFSPEIQNRLKNYLLLASEFQLLTIKPIQWRKAVFEFSLNRYQPGISVPDKRFAVDFIAYLNTHYPQIDWEESFKAVYRKLQVPKGKNNIAFPQEIVDLFGLEPEQAFREESKFSKQKNRPAIDETGLELKIRNSGLVLFWPFLTRLFERLGLIENNAFINPESRNRAVYILQYLVYNEISFPEYTLVLNKLLVGMPTEEHLDPFIGLSEDEKDGTRSLLNGLIGNWEKVKNSSPEAIQETFLQREGTLKFQTDGILLVVEKKTVDVLMGSIPWSISVVKLPWMEKPVFVKWT